MPAYGFSAAGGSAAQSGTICRSAAGSAKLAALSAWRYVHCASAAVSSVGPAGRPSPLPANQVLPTTWKPSKLKSAFTSLCASAVPWARPAFAGCCGSSRVTRKPVLPGRCVASTRSSPASGWISAPVWKMSAVALAVPSAAGVTGGLAAAPIEAKVSSGAIGWLAPLTAIVAPGRSRLRTSALAVATAAAFRASSGNAAATEFSVSPATISRTAVRA